MTTPPTMNLVLRFMPRGSSRPGARRAPARGGPGDASRRAARRRRGRRPRARSPSSRASGGVLLQARDLYPARQEVRKEQQERDDVQVERDLQGKGERRRLRAEDG